MGLRVLRKEDIPFAVHLTEVEGWYYTSRELEVMLRLDPDGSFIFEEGEPLGFATSVTYGRTGVLGHLIVSKKGRGRSIGSSLVESAVRYMEGRGVDSIIVLATQEGVGLYQKHGFAICDEISCVHSRLDSQFKHTASPACIPMAESDLREVAEIDESIFGDDRSRLLDSLYQEAPEHCHKLVRAGRIAGFIFARPDHIGYNLGPWMCLTENSRDADALFQTALSNLGEGLLYSGSFARNKDAVGIVSGLPRVREWRIPMMIRGRPRYGSSTSKVYGIAAFELG